MPENVEALAPTRIDLAGGTIDLWPLYLLHDDPVTVNAAIDQFARARVETTRGPGIDLVSVDRGRQTRFDSVARLLDSVRQAPAELEFPMRLAAHFLRGAAGGDGISCRITTDCQAPAGSGLGGSSTLGIALSTALDRYTRRGLDPAGRLALTRMIETQVLRIPTGEQDYHPALHGGVLALHYTVEGTRVEALGVDLEELRQRTVLVFTGVSRSSGLSNWDMLKRHLDGDSRVHRALERILEATRHMRRALLARDWDAAAEALGEEWTARREMSPLVTTDAIDRMIRVAVGEGAIAGKVCGAGGGGCVVLWVKRGRREAVIQRVARNGARVIDFHYSREGVRVTES
jgi:D-glycero-alpha-D-manno-heptose-7-phosphate kinase